MTATVMAKGYVFDVEYKIHGKYIPANRYEPEEYPEVEIITIRSVTDDLRDILYDGVSEEDIQIALEEALCERGEA